MDKAGTDRAECKKKMAGALVNARDLRIEWTDGAECRRKVVDAIWSLVNAKDLQIEWRDRQPQRLACY